MDVRWMFGCSAERRLHGFMGLTPKEWNPPDRLFGSRLGSLGPNVGSGITMIFDGNGGLKGTTNMGASRLFCTSIFG